MNKSENWLVHEHSLYEELLTRCQDAVEMEEWGMVNRLFNELIANLKRHMTLEEEVLYPAYEAAPHAPQGPTTALREEHANIVSLIRDMTRIIQTRDSGHVLESLSHLEARMIKHHEKEEDIFLPMASHILNADRDELLQKIAGFDTSKLDSKWDI